MRDFIRKRLDPAERYGLRASLFALTVALVGVPFGILLEQVVGHGGLVYIDTAAARRLHAGVRGHPLLIGALKALTFIGTPQFLTFLVIVSGVFLLRRGRKRLAAFLGITALGGGIVDSLVKIAVNRPRPNLVDPLIPPHGKSFPSGHAMSSTIVYGALLLILFPIIPRAQRWTAVAGVCVLVLAIGVSRLALGVHYITDVAGGIVLGVAWLTASTAAFSIWREERGRKPVSPSRGLESEAKRDLMSRG